MSIRLRPTFYIGLLACVILLAALSACATKQVEKIVTQVVVATQPPAAPVTQVVGQTSVVKETQIIKEVTQVVTQIVEVTQPPAKSTEATVATQPAPLPQPTATPAPVILATASPLPIPTSAQPTPTGPVLQPQGAQPTPPVEMRTIELEWPPRLRLGDSDTVRLALIPSQAGYTITTEFPEHTTVTQTVTVKRPPGYELMAAATLVGVGFELSPTGEQERQLPSGETVTWRWSITPRTAGQQRISVSVLLRWQPLPGTAGVLRESGIYSRSLTVNVVSFFGLTRGQAMTGGLFGLVFGGSVSLLALAYPARRRRPGLKAQAPNQRLAIESRPGIEIRPNEQALLRALFNRYGRVSIESEFLSGYSGARTYLAVPIRPDGRADAYTIVKIGDRETIQREYENYETFVKDSLPPITARIQHAPVVLASPRFHPGTAGGSPSRAAVQYTFIGAPGLTPTSLRQALLANPDPALLEKLFETFGPNWWMQRHPYTFRLAQEYDRMLPAHYVILPEASRGKVLDGKQPPARASLDVGERVILRGFSHIERRADGQSLSLRGEATPGQPPIRVRWLGLSDPDGASGRVVATRQTLLREFTTGFDLLGLPDPLLKLPGLLDERLSGTQSTIHGDLNLENILVGPGGFGPQGFVWLIDFAQTRDGHPLYDFAHLEAEIIAHVIAPHINTPGDYLSLLQSADDARRDPYYALRFTLQSIASRCLFNPTQPREYDLALFMACLGALKFNNLNPQAKQLLFLSAAQIGQTL